MEKLSFKQYRESKEQLLRSIANAPVSIIEYEIKRYCTFAIGNTDEVQMVGLKPKQSIVLEWSHMPSGVAVLEAIRLIGVNNIDEREIHSNDWSRIKLTNWLARYTTGGQHRNHIL